MSKFNIFFIIMMLFVFVQISSAKELKENIDFKCIDKGVTADPPPKIKTGEDKNFTPLCSNGKVPKAIFSNEQSQELDKKIKGVPKNSTREYTATCLSSACYNWAHTNEFVTNNGISSYLTQHDPEISTDSYHSIAEIAIMKSVSGSPGNLWDYIEIGWRKAYGDVTRLFTFWWKDGVSQCYNTQCSGWVQTSTKYYPGMPLDVDTNGKMYAIQTGPGYNWWYWYNDDWIGYYPQSLWNNEFTGGDNVLYYGEVASKSLNPTITDMGSGYWAAEASAAEFKYPSYLDSSIWHASQNLNKIISSQDLYTLEPYFDEYYNGVIRFGGPGFEMGIGGCSILDIKYPNTGDTLNAGQQATIQWDYDGCAGPYVKLELLKQDDTLAYTITNSAEIGDLGLGNYAWNIPLNLEVGDYKIRITSSYSPDLNWNVSGTFHIKKDYQQMAFARGTDNALWYRQFTGTSWVYWQSLGGILLSDPDAVSYSNGNVAVVVEGNDHALYIKIYSGSTSTWGNWQKLGGILGSGPSIAASGDNLYVFAQGLNHDLWYRKFDGTTWGDWNNLGGILTSDPDVEDNLDIAARGTDNALWIKPYNWATNTWDNWYSLGGILKGGPSITYGYNLRVFVRGTSDDLWNRYYNPYDGWFVWQSLGGIITSDPDATSVETPNYVLTSIAARGTDNALWYMTYDGSTFSDWKSLGGIISSGPVIVTIHHIWL